MLAGNVCYLDREAVIAITSLRPRSGHSYNEAAMSKKRPVLTGLIGALDV